MGFLDESAWVAISFAIVIAVFLYLGLPRKVLAALDSKAEAIADELAQAKALREDAEKLLADYKAKQQQAKAEAEQILNDARARAETMAEQAKQAMEAQLIRRQAEAERKIARSEEEILKQLRGAVVTAAIDASEQIITENMTPEAAQAMMNETIKELQ